MAFYHFGSFNEEVLRVAFRPRRPRASLFEPTFSPLEMLPAAILAPLIGSALVLAGSSSAESHAQESSSLPTSRLLTLANEASSAGQYARAIDLYGTVVEREPQDYLSLYKRSTAYMAAGQSKKAADDLEHVLRLSKEFDSVGLDLDVF